MSSSINLQQSASTTCIRAWGDALLRIQVTGKIGKGLDYCISVIVEIGRKPADLVSSTSNVHVQMDGSSIPAAELGLFLRMPPVTPLLPDANT